MSTEIWVRYLVECLPLYELANGPLPVCVEGDVVVLRARDDPSVEVARAPLGDEGALASLFWRAWNFMLPEEYTLGAACCASALRGALYRLGYTLVPSRHELRRIFDLMENLRLSGTWGLEGIYLRIRTEAGTELGGYAGLFETHHRLLRFISQQVAAIPSSNMTWPSVHEHLSTLLPLLSNLAEQLNYPWYKESHEPQS